MSKAVQYPKRLIEVDLPIRRISSHARREKSIRHGHISTLHIWWARRPLAACRAVLCAALWPDPADGNCPKQFLETAKSEMKNWSKYNLNLLSAESFQNFVLFQKSPHLLDDPINLRTALLDFIADFSNWDNSDNGLFVNTSKKLTESAHSAIFNMPSSRPLVLDPFAGGGSIPLEALRVGADSFASDLNPLPVLLNKVSLEYIPKYRTRLSEQVSRWGKWIKQKAGELLDGCYPIDLDGSIPVAYLWARTIRCEGPGCGAQVPLIRSPWLAKRGNKSVAISIAPDASGRMIDIDIIHNPKSSLIKHGTVRRGSATCPCCGYTTSADRVREQFQGRSGGASDARCFAVITSKPNTTGRFYRKATIRDLDAFDRAKARLDDILSKQDCDKHIPNEELPYLRSIFNINLLDAKKWSDLFSSRQLLALSTLNDLIVMASVEMSKEFDKEFSKAVATCLALVVGRQADKLSSLARWDSTRENAQGTFGRQALPIVWDYNEVNPFSGSGGDWDTALNWVLMFIEKESKSKEIAGQSMLASATKHPLPDDSVALVVTDPPYYDAVPYADLSDFFYVWLKRSIGIIYPELFDSQLSPKKLEVVQLAERNSKYAYKTKENFENLMREALSEARRVAHPNGLGVIVFAHKATSAWEVMLQAVIDAGWIIVGSWPIDTEMENRLRAMNSATLSSSVHLVCRPRETQDGALRMDEVGDWRDVLAELPIRIHEWMPRLASEGVVGADAIFACLGPALEIFSRYSRVEKANGEIVPLGSYLEHVWAAVAKEALSMVFRGASAEGFEPDSRLTAMWLWTVSREEFQLVEEEFESDSDSDEEVASVDQKKLRGGFVLEYDAARKIAQGLGANLEEMRSLVEVHGESARLLPVQERAGILFGKETIQQSAVKPRSRQKQQALPGFEEIVEEVSGFGLTGGTKAKVGHTVLDRVHQSMLLFGAGRSEALKAFLVDEGVGSDARFWRLAQALSALYPRDTQEKRWVDGVLARKKGLGF